MENEVLQESIVNQTTSGIDNEWYTFVTNDQTSDDKAETMVEPIQFEAIETKEAESLIVAKDVPSKTRESLFECDICKKSFNFKSNLKKQKNSYRRITI